MRIVLVLSAIVFACGESKGSGPIDAARSDGPMTDAPIADAPTGLIDATLPDGTFPPIDAARADANLGPDSGTGPFAGDGEVCGTNAGDLDAGALPCAPGLVCCYPCGIPDCH